MAGVVDEPDDESRNRRYRDIFFQPDKKGGLKQDAEIAATASVDKGGNCRVDDRVGADQ
jgi:hypothetical protein